MVGEEGFDAAGLPDPDLFLTPETKPYPKYEKAPANAEAKNMVGEECFDA